MAGNHTLGTIRGTIEIDYDGAGIVRATKDTQKAKLSMDNLDKGSSRVLNGFKKFASGALLVSKYVGAAYNAVTLMASSVAVLAPITAAAFAAAPALVLGFVAALGVMKIALTGVGDALKLAGEGGEKFDEAMKKLSPQAQEFVKAYQAVIPQLSKVRTAIQDAFFNTARRGVAEFVGQVVKLGPSAATVADKLGRVAQSTVSWLSSNKSIEGLAAVLHGVGAFLDGIKASLGPVLQGFIGVAAQGAAFGEVLGKKVGTALAGLAKFLAQIDVGAIFQRALPILQMIGTLFGDIFSIVSQFFAMFNVDGASAIGTLGVLVSQLRAFLQTAEGQSALAALGQALQAIAGASGQVFLALLNAIAPAIVALAPGVAELAGQISGALVPAIQAVAPILQSVAGFLSENMSWIGPVAAGVVGLAAAYKTYAAAATAVKAVQTALNSTMLVSAAGWIRQTAAVVANRVAMIAAAVASGVVRAATIAWTAVQWLLNAALTANPIGIVIVAVAALIAGIILLWKNSETFRTIVLAVWGAIKAYISGTVNFLVNTVWPLIKQLWNNIVIGAQAMWQYLVAVWNNIKKTIQVALAIIRAVVTSVWSAIVNGVKAYINVYRTIISAGFNAAKTVITTVLNAVRAVVNNIWRGITATIKAAIATVRAVISGISAVVGIVRNAFNNARNAAASALGNLIATVRGIPGRVVGALGNLAGLLYSKGQSLVQGFIDGLASMIGRVGDTASSLVSAVTNFLPGSPAKEGPLSGRGYALLRARRMMADLARGMEDGADWPVQAMRGAITPVARATAPAGSTTRTGAFNAGTTPLGTFTGGGRREYNIGIGTKPFAKLVVDAITGEPVAVSKASNEGSRRTAWAGSGR